MDDNAIKSIENLFEIKEETEMIKGRSKLEILGTFSDQEKKDYFKPVTAGNFWSKSCIGYGPYLKDINDFKKSYLENSTDISFLLRAVMNSV